jgi:hypothetical protein
LDEFTGDIFLFGLFAFELPQVFVKEDRPQYTKHDEELDQDNQPKGSPERHASETLRIKAEYTHWYRHFLHIHSSIDAGFTVQETNINKKPCISCCLASVSYKERGDFYFPHQND